MSGLPAGENQAALMDTLSETWKKRASPVALDLLTTRDYLPMQYKCRYVLSSNSPLPGTGAA